MSGRSPRGTPPNKGLHPTALRAADEAPAVRRIQKTGSNGFRMDIRDFDSFSKANALEVLAFIADASIAECAHRGLKWTIERILAKQPRYTLQLVALVRVLANDSSLMRAKSFGYRCRICSRQFLESCELLEQGKLDDAASCLQELSSEEQTYCESIARSLRDIFYEDQTES